MIQPGEQVLQALEAAKKEHPDLVEWLDFHREVLIAQQAAEPALLPLVQPVTSERVDARKEARQPLFTFDELEVDWLVVYGLISQLEKLATQRLPGRPAGIPADIAEETVRAWYAGQTPTDPHTAFLISQALRPFLHRAARAASVYLTTGDYWHWGHCPACGGEPDFAVLERESGTRQLFCSRCDTGWHFKRIACPFCDTENPRSLAYYPGEDGAYRLYVCAECHCYVKTLDLRETFGLFVLQVERVLTAGMDLAAVAEGYRPSAYARER